MHTSLFTKQIKLKGEKENRTIQHLLFSKQFNILGILCHTADRKWAVSGIFWPRQYKFVGLGGYFGLTFKINGKAKPKMCLYFRFYYLSIRKTFQLNSFQLLRNSIKMIMKYSWNKNWQSQHTCVDMSETPESKYRSVFGLFCFVCIH